jgi:hypothetical protein
MGEVESSASCGQNGPLLVPSLNAQGMAGCGGFQRSVPVGGAA